MSILSEGGGLKRVIDLRGAVSINVITMIGIGPLVTIPLVIAALGGPLALVGWIAGAVVALCDGLVWAELSSRFPGSGGTYVYLRDAFGERGLGRALAFLFNWQFLLYAPCLLASGYIGFANYAAYLYPDLGSNLAAHDALAVGIGIVTILLLYRRTAQVSSVGAMLAVAAVLTVALVALAGLSHANYAQAFHLGAPLRLTTGFLAGFGSALYIALYDYVGYADAALLGDEVVRPRRTIPMAILLSVLIVAVLYVLLQIGVLGAVPWQSLLDAHGQPTPQSQYVGALVVEHAWGRAAAISITLLVLVTAFASLYGNLLGFSRISFAAARDGAFLSAFARLHPRKDIPHVALFAVGALSLVASLFTLDQVIAFLTAGI
ncbi:MAG TPA: APC family permease, partial [Candidatus Dormibacteraeota bacterium]|nr:APC family permease [Candidatus Dormibacteraeota bacterium]